MKKIVYFSIATIIVLMLSVAVVLLLTDRVSPKNEDIDAKDIDLAILDVLNSNLLDGISYVEEESIDVVFSKGYYDGIRLYVQIEGVASKEALTKMIAISNGTENVPDIIINLNEYNDIYDQDSWLIVYNYFLTDDSKKIVIKFDSFNAITLEISRSTAKQYSTTAFFEEIDVQNIMLGRTVTLMECKLIANIKGISFQAEMEDSVLPIYVIEKNGMEYVLLIPKQLNEASKFTLISNNEYGVELRIPIDLSTIISEGVQQ